MLHDINSCDCPPPSNLAFACTLATHHLRTESCLGTTPPSDLSPHLFPIAPIHRSFLAQPFATLRRTPSRRLCASALEGSFSAAPANPAGISPLLVFCAILLSSKIATRYRTASIPPRTRIFRDGPRHSPSSFCFFMPTLSSTHSTRICALRHTSRQLVSKQKNGEMPSKAPPRFSLWTLTVYSLSCASSLTLSLSVRGLAISSSRSSLPATRSSAG